MTEKSPQSSAAPATAESTGGVMRRDVLRGAGMLGGLAMTGLPVSLAAAEQAATTGPASSAAFSQLLQTLQQISSQYFTPAWGVNSIGDIAEGYRSLMSFLDVGIRLYFEGNPDWPEFQPIVSPTIKIQGDNPDALYFYTRIRSDRNYRIRGRRVGETYLSYTVHSGDGNGGWATGIDATKNFRQMHFDADGNYELLVGPDVDADKGLRTGPHSQEIVVRNYFERKRSVQLDPDVHPVLAIEPLDPSGPPPGAPSDAEIARRLQTTSNFLLANTIQRPKPNPAKMPSWFSMRPNQMGKPERWTSGTDGGGLGAVDNAYSAGRFVLTPDQALIMEGHLPNCVFANVVLWNRYLQSFDFRYRQISLNRKQIKLEADGSYRIIIAHRDPGLPNWLSTEGRANGTIFWRFLLSEGDLETPRTRVVSLADLEQLKKA